jgi:hypothetical protein
LAQLCDRYSGPSPNLDQANPGRFQPFAALDDIRNNSSPFAEAREAKPYKSRDVHEHVLAAAIPSDEAEALLDVEPTHRASLLDGRPARYRSRETRSPWWRWNSGTGIDAQNLGDVRPFVSWTNANFDCFARLHGVDAAPSEDAAV